MSDTPTTNTVTELVNQLVEAQGNLDCNGVLIIHWEADNTVSARYAGVQMAIPQIITLAANGIQSLCGSVRESDSQVESPVDLTLVSDD